jgi:hypothetical protein
MDFSYTEGNAVDTFHVSDFGAFGQPYRLEDAVVLSGSKSYCNPTSHSLHVTKQIPSVISMLYYPVSWCTINLMKLFFFLFLLV